MRPGQICTTASTLVALAGGASSATPLVAASLVAFAFCLASACSAAAAILAASTVATLLLFMNPLGRKSVPDLLCRAKAW